MLTARVETVNIFLVTIHSIPTLTTRILHQYYKVIQSVEI